ncbi:multicopper oxidase family protein [Stappia sp.]|uniref:multicopper oxidase family protein n=1 Tax=Stappia sp. TaxID=1870903 RepID=UPI0032D99A15
MMALSRRGFLAGAGTALLAARAPGLALARDARATAGGVIDLVAGPSRAPIGAADALPSNLWTYNASAPGPEIRVTRGARVRVRLTNRLEEPTSVHWHGLRLANAMDGVAGLTQAPIAPGETFAYDFVAPDAGTYWYHAHNKSWNQVARGLYGALIVEEEVPAFPPERDLTLMLDDWVVGDDGRLDLASLGSLMDWSHAGRLGNRVTVNGRVDPLLTVPADMPCRLRLINASNARIFALDPNRFDARVLAYDGQALPEPVRLAYAPLLLGPAQRVDLLVVPEAGTQIPLEDVSGAAPLPLARIRAGEPPDAPAERAGEVPVVRPNPLPEPDLASARTVRLRMTGGAMRPIGPVTYRGEEMRGGDFRRTRQAWAFNGVANMPETPLFAARRGETIVLETVNETAFIHAMHVHGHHFRILQRSGSDIDEGRPWRDTFLIGPDQTTRIAFVADNPGKWLYHCHMLEHAAAGMTTWFDVS